MEFLDEGHPAERHHADRPQQHQAAAAGHRRLAPPGKDGSSRRSASMARPKTADEHFEFWTGFLDKRPLSWTASSSTNSSSTIPRTRKAGTLSPERQERMEREKATASRLRRGLQEDACRRPLQGQDGLCLRRRQRQEAEPGGDRHDVRPHPASTATIAIALERYLFEVSSEQKSQDALQLFVDGIADWEAKEPGVKEADGDRLRPVLDAARRHQQAAERRLPRLDGPADERRGQPSGAGGHGRPGTGGRRSWPTRKRCDSSASCTGTTPSRAKPRC